MFDSTTMHNWVAFLRQGLEQIVPASRISTSTLGGRDRPIIFIMASLDPKESWSNGILENSRYFRISLQHDGELEHFSGHGCGKFRKSHVKSVEDALAKISKFIEKAKSLPDFPS